MRPHPLVNQGPFQPRVKSAHLAYIVKQLRLNIVGVQRHTHQWSECEGGVYSVCTFALSIERSHPRLSFPYWRLLLVCIYVSGSE